MTNKTLSWVVGSIVAIVTGSLFLMLLMVIMIEVTFRMLPCDIKSVDKLMMVTIVT